MCALIVASAIPFQGILDVPEDDVAQHVRLLTHLTHAQNTVPIAAIHPLSTGSSHFLREHALHTKLHMSTTTRHARTCMQAVNRRICLTFCH